MHHEAFHRWHNFPRVQSKMPNQVGRRFEYFNRLKWFLEHSCKLSITIIIIVIVIIIIILINITAIPRKVFYFPQQWQNYFRYLLAKAQLYADLKMV